VGESLSPGVWPLLDLVGLRHRVAQAGFRAPGETLLCWAEPSAWRLPSAAKAGALLAERSVFDALLLDAAREAGVEILQPARAHAERRPEAWSIRIDLEERSFSSKLLLDASGRKGFLPKRSLAYAARTCALWGNFRLSTETTCVEAVPAGWLWAAPTGAKRLSVLFFCEPSFVRSRTDGWREALLREQLSRSTLLAECATGELHSSVEVLDATCRFTPENIGDGFIRIGEANYTVDPLSSTGVEKALQTALWGALAAHTLLRHPSRAALCSQFYRERQAEAIHAHREWSGRFYGEVVRFGGEPFWSRRRLPLNESSPSEAEAVPVRPPPAAATQVHLHPDAALREEPCVHGEFIAARLALHAPALLRPVVFLDGIEVAPLLADAAQPARWSELLAGWGERLSPARADRVADWLWSRGVLIGASRGSHTPPP
jgi:hypothetical protein